MTSIIILSYNTQELLELCLDSIRLNTKAASYELIVVDNASSDGSVEYLQQQGDIKVIYNSENMGFPKACNQGLEIATGDDLLLLNSDTIVTPRWLEQLTYCLYAREKHGAVSCVTNSCSNWQQINVPYRLMDIDGLFEFADKFNHIDEAKWERRLKLVGFCFLIKREVYEKLGGLDERFTPGNFEDDDYSLRVWQAGYECILARDTFIHHFGSASFKKKEKIEAKSAEKYNNLLLTNQRKFLDKWQISERYVTRDSAVIYLGEKLLPQSKVLLLDCHAGTSLFYLESLHRELQLYGITVNKNEYEVIKNSGLVIRHCRDLGVQLWDAMPKNLDAIFISDDISLDRGAIYRFLQHIRIGGMLGYRDISAGLERIACVVRKEVKTELDENKICFISAVHKPDVYDKICLPSIQRLKVPSGMAVETLVIQDAASMTEAYQTGMEASNAKYKIYVHQDAEILDENFLLTLVHEFKKHPECGIAGVVGSANLPPNAVWWDGKMLGSVYDDHAQPGTMQKYVYEHSNTKSLEAVALDGLILMTQYDMAWRTDIFTDWHFYDISQVQEFRQQGYSAMVLPAKEPLIRHYCGMKAGWQDMYVRNRDKFVREYM